MTVSTSTNRANANGDGVLTQFFFTFKTNDIADIRVYLDTVLQSTGYTVNLNADQDSSPGGDVTFTTAPASAVVVTIERYLIALQGIDYTPFDKFPSETHELGLDELVMMVQQLLDETGRSLKSAVDTAPGVNFTLPSPVSERFLRWNTAADNIENLDIVDLSLYAISDFAKTLVDDTTADDFWATLMATITKATALSTLGAASLIAANVFAESQTFSKTQILNKGADIASANDTVLLDDGNINDVTGSVNINGLTTPASGNPVRRLAIVAAPLLKHNTAPSAGFSKLYIAQGAADYQASAGDEVIAYYDDISDFWIIRIDKADGKSVIPEINSFTAGTTYTWIVAGFTNKYIGESQQTPSLDDPTDSFGSTIVSDYLAYKKAIEIKLGRKVSGTFKLKLKLAANVGTIFGQIYRNGSIVGAVRSTSSSSWTEFIEDISGWSEGDLLQVYLKADVEFDAGLAKLQIQTNEAPGPAIGMIFVAANYDAVTVQQVEM